MAHEIDKNKMKNDIVLTVVLIISLVLVRLIMKVTGLEDYQHNTAIYFILSFICIKVTYNLFNRIVEQSKQKK